jgi:hypothetical protein
MYLSHHCRIYVTAKRRPIQKNALPDIKYLTLPHPLSSKLLDQLIDVYLHLFLIDSLRIIKLPPLRS